MKYILLALITTFGLALGVAGCKSGGASEGPGAAAGAAHDDDDHDHGDDDDHGDHHGDEGHHDHEGEDAPVAFDAAPAVGTLAKCPVSGEVFEVEADTDRAEHAGKHYAFCCSNCAGKFKADPAKFVSK